MQAFTHYTPTEIVFGKASEDKVAELAKKYHGSRVFVVYGGGSVVKSGLLERVTGTLEAAGLKVETIGGVKPNPRLDFAREAVKKAIEFQADSDSCCGRRKCDRYREGSFPRSRKSGYGYLGVLVTEKESGENSAGRCDSDPCSRWK